MLVVRYVLSRCVKALFCYLGFSIQKTSSASFFFYYHGSPNKRYVPYNYSIVQEILFFIVVTKNYDHLSPFTGGLFSSSSSPTSVIPSLRTDALIRIIVTVNLTKYYFYDKSSSLSHVFPTRSKILPCQHLLLQHYFGQSCSSTYYQKYRVLTLLHLYSTRSTPHPHHHHSLIRYAFPFKFP